MKILVTGCAGFIGMHASERLLARGDQVIGIDNMNDYYEVSLKEARLARLLNYQRFQFHRINIIDRVEMPRLFESEKPDIVVHLAAQAGVRHSIEHPEAYIDSNLVGFGNILEACRNIQVKHLIYASSSSVYGGNQKIPFSETDRVDHPVSLYAATKKANELMAHTYSHLFNIPTTGLRFFTVYGPWGRPDMSPFLFTRAILNKQAIRVFNHGNMMRDFTYIEDITEGIVRVIDKSFESNPPSDSPVALSNSLAPTPYRIFNIGNNAPVQLLDYIHALEKSWGSTTKKELLPMQAGDIQKTMADTSRLESWIGFRPETPLEVGIDRFVNWYRDYYKIGTQ